MRLALAIAALAPLAASCGGYGERYPSYDAIVSQYAGADQLRREPIAPGDAPECEAGECDCPRVWFDAHWVYYCDGRWVYWYGDLWYVYPGLGAAYVGGAPYPALGPVRSIERAPAGRR